jgi:hypothetical protein
MMLVHFRNILFLKIGMYKSSQLTNIWLQLKLGVILIGN